VLWQNAPNALMPVGNLSRKIRFGSEREGITSNDDNNNQIPITSSPTSTYICKYVCMYVCMYGMYIVHT